MSAIGLLNNEFGNELMKALINLSKEYLQWNDFITDFNTYTNKELVYEFERIDKQLKNKQMQYHFTPDNPKNTSFINGLIIDIRMIERNKNEIKDELWSQFHDLIKLILSKSTDD